MLVNKHREVRLFATSQVRVVLRALVQDDVGQVRLDFLNPSEVLLSKLNSFLRVILKLDGVLVGCKVLTRSKRSSNSGISLLFPAASIALDWRAVRIRLAGHFDPL